MLKRITQHVQRVNKASRTFFCTGALKIVASHYCRPCFLHILQCVKSFLFLVEFLLINILAFVLSRSVAYVITSVYKVEASDLLRLIIHFSLVILFLLMIFLLKCLMRFFFWSLLFQIFIFVLLLPGWENETRQFSLHRCWEFYATFLVLRK